VRELLTTVDSDELTHWQAYAELEPFGGLAADWRAGLVAAAVLNVHRAPGSQALLPHDLVPRLASPPPPPLDDPDAEIEAFDRLVGLA